MDKSHFVLVYDGYQRRRKIDNLDGEVIFLEEWKGCILSKKIDSNFRGQV